MAQYRDLHNLSEDERITEIGTHASKGKNVGVFLERDEPEKIERYIKKVTERFPNVMLVNRVNGPSDLVVTLTFGAKH